MEEQEREEYLSRGPFRCQVRKRRKGGWTKRDIAVFFDHFRVTCNITAAAKAAGKTAGGVHQMLKYDVAFAAQFREELGAADLRLRSKAALYAETSGKPQAASEDGEPAEAPIEDLDPVFTLKFLAHNRDRIAGLTPRGGPRPKGAGADDLVAQLARRFAALERRRARRGGL